VRGLVVCCEREASGWCSKITMEEGKDFLSVMLQVDGGLRHIHLKENCQFSQIHSKEQGR